MADYRFVNSMAKDPARPAKTESTEPTLRAYLPGFVIRAGLINLFISMGY